MRGARHGAGDDLGPRGQIGQPAQYAVRRDHQVEPLVEVLRYVVQVRLDEARGEISGLMDKIRVLSTQIRRS